MANPSQQGYQGTALPGNVMAKEDESGGLYNGSGSSTGATTTPGQNNLGGGQVANGSTPPGFAIPTFDRAGAFGFPYGSLSDQLRDAISMYQRGAGPLNNNAAPRYGFAQGYGGYKPPGAPTPPPGGATPPPPSPGGATTPPPGGSVSSPPVNNGLPWWQRPVPPGGPYAGGSFTDPRTPSVGPYNPGAQPGTGSTQTPNTPPPTPSITPSPGLDAKPKAYDPAGDGNPGGPNQYVIRNGSAGLLSGVPPSALQAMQMMGQSSDPGAVLKTVGDQLSQQGMSQATIDQIVQQARGGAGQGIVAATQGMQQPNFAGSPYAQFFSGRPGLMGA